MRRKREQEDSLDMLLDTITNTFGGIVFLALLIVLLTQNEKPDTGAQDNTTELESIAAKIELLELRESELQQTQKAQAIVGGFDQIKNKSATVERLQKQAQDYAKRKDDVKTLVKNQISESKQLNAKLLESEKLKKEIETEERKKKQLTKSLEVEIESRKRQIDTPKEKSTTKFPSTVLAMQGKLFFLRGISISSAQNVNLQDFESCDRDEAVVLLDSGNYRPKKNAGVLLTNVGPLRQKLKQIDPRQSYLQIAIWDETFPNFDSLKGVCRKLNLEYQLILMSAGGKLVESSDVAPPKVQIP